MSEPVLVSWSGGKDSAMALAKVLAERDYKPHALLTSVTEDYDRITMHGVRHELLKRQGELIQIPLTTCRIPKLCPNEVYEERWLTTLKPFYDGGIRKVVFGDIFLEDIRKYRETQLKKLGMTAVFPLWGAPTQQLAKHFTTAGFKAVLVCVDTQALAKEFAGREYDEQLLLDLPAAIDPCGERGEFHTFVYALPFVKGQVAFTKGPVVLREERFAFCDLLPHT